MNWYEIVLGVVLIAVSVLIVVFTVAQERKGQDGIPEVVHFDGEQAGLFHGRIRDRASLAMTCRFSR